MLQVQLLVSDCCFVYSVFQLLFQFILSVVYIYLCFGVLCYELKMPCCSIAGYNNNERNSKDKGISFHHFPKHKHLQNTWIHACKRSDNFCINYARILCSDHFAEDDFEHDLRAELLNLKFIKCFKSTAVPHIKIPSIVSSANADRRGRAQKQESQKTVERLLKVPEGRDD